MIFKPRSELGVTRTNSIYTFILLFGFQKAITSPTSKVGQNPAIYGCAHHDVDDNAYQAVDQGKRRDLSYDIIASALILQKRMKMEAEA